MSGGHFDYRQYGMRDIAEAIERDVALALKPKPEKVHEDYWTIFVQKTQHSYTHYCNYCRFSTYKEAECYLLSDNTIEKADNTCRGKCLCNPGEIVFKSKNLRMNEQDGNFPVLYWIHHCVYDHYPYDTDVLELSEESLETMKEAYRQIRIAQIYAHRVDWMKSGDDSEETMQQRLMEDLMAFEEEFKDKDWTEE
ncbi:MAG: hypothetical protein IJ383_05315 [Bacteroidales bacterium]|nr:hypothetical protein [Bacteroidales bacterium]